MKVTGRSVEQLEKGKPKGKCKKWRLWATTECGRKSRRITGTWTAAQDALAAFVDELMAMSTAPDEFSTYARSWLSWRLDTGQVRPGTAKSYNTVLNALSRSPMAGVRVADATPDDCRDALMWVKYNPARGGTMSNTTLRTCYAVMRLVFQQAVDDGKRPDNPMAHVERPKKERVDRRALDAVEVAALLDSLDAAPLDSRVVAVYLMLMLGLRRGESVALLVDDIHGGLMHVHGSVVESTGEIGETKTEAGKRTLPVPPRLQAKVDEWLEIRGALGLGGAPTLCCNTRGGVLRPQNLQDWWESRRDGLGVPGLVLHELRHTNLTLMARHMSAFDLQRYAGWSSLAPALLYVHDDVDAISRGVAAAWCGLDAPKTHHPEVRVIRHSA